MIQKAVEMLQEQRRLKNLGSKSPDIHMLHDILREVRRDPDTLSDVRLRRVLSRSGRPNWDAPPQALCLVEEIRRTAEWALRHRARPRSPAHGTQHSPDRVAGPAE